jgi:hypothetical protein
VQAAAIMLVKLLMLSSWHVLGYADAAACQLLLQQLPHNMMQLLQELWISVFHNQLRAVLQAVGST